MGAGSNRDSDPESSGGSTPGLGAGSADSALDRRFKMALGLYAVLGALVWFTLDVAPVRVFGQPVSLRLLVLVVLAGFVLRTVIARKAEEYRRDRK
jgi:hypothetical protein